MRVAIVGAGRMGSAAARRLAKLGFDLVIWNRTRERAESLAREIGVRDAGTLIEALSHSQIALAMLADDEALLSVVSSMRRMDGLILVNCSTVTPKASIAVSKHLEGLGIGYVEAPIVGGPGALERGEAIILVSGRRADVAAAGEVLDALGEVFVVGWKYGLAPALKLAFNNLLLASIAGLSESLLILDAYGLDKRLFRDLLGRTVFASFSEKYLERAVEGRKPTFTSRLAGKDARYAAEALADRGYPRIVSSRVADIYDLISSLGGGEDDYVGIYNTLKRLSERVRG
ncbi:MAG: NAD(P)-dependent oxidoreductase [Aeropyrum sp.]|nr:NAD(P)-dependent oxidoreductase [Aeropyrum sp.]